MTASGTRIHNEDNTFNGEQFWCLFHLLSQNPSFPPLLVHRVFFSSTLLSSFIHCCGALSSIFWQYSLLLYRYYRITTRMAFHHAPIPSSRDLEEMERQNERDDEGAHHEDDATLRPPRTTTQISSYQHAPSSPITVHQHPHLLMNFKSDKKGKSKDEHVVFYEYANEQEFRKKNGQCSWQYVWDETWWYLTMDGTCALPVLCLVFLVIPGVVLFTFTRESS